MNSKKHLNIFTAILVVMFIVLSVIVFNFIQLLPQILR